MHLYTEKDISWEAYRSLCFEIIEWLLMAAAAAFNQTHQVPLNSYGNGVPIAG